MLYLQKSEKIEICTAPLVPPLQGAVSEADWGLYRSAIFPKNDTIADLQQPPASAALRQPPLWRGHEGVQRRFRA